MAEGALRKLFNIYPGEGLKALFFVAIAFLSSFGAMGGATLIDGQFLEHLGPEALPLTYLWTAGALVCMAPILIWGLKRFTSRTFFSILLAEITLFYGAAAFITSFPVYLCVFIKVVADLSIWLIMTGLWTVVGGAYDLQDSKRLFGLFSAAPILGAAMGSGFVSLGLTHLGFNGLVATFAAAIFAAFLLSLWCRSNEQALEEPDGDVGWRPLLKQVLCSRFTLYLLLFNIILALIEVVCEFDYMATLTSVLGGSETSGIVTRFLGKARGWVYVGDMIFGMFLYGRLIKRIGINNASLVSAGYFLTLFMVGTPLNGLLIAILGLVAIEGILPILENSNFSLLLNAVPQRLRSRFRVAVEYCVQPIGMLGGSFLLILFQHHVKYLGLGLAIAGVTLAFFMRRRYPRAIYENLREREVLFGSPAESYLEKLPRKELKRLPQKLLKDLPHLTPSAQIIAIECLVLLSGKTLLPELTAALEKLSEKSVLEVFALLRLTQFVKDPSLVEAIHKLEARPPSRKHQGYALLFLAKQGRVSDAVATRHLASFEPSLRATAILAILSKTDDPRREVAYSLLQRMVASTNEEEIAVALDLLSTLGGPRHTSTLRRFLHHSSPTIAAKAIRRLGNMEGVGSDHLRRIAELLVGRATPNVRRACLDVLDGRLPIGQIEPIIRAAACFCPLHKTRAENLVYQVGKRAIPTLVHILRSPHYSHNERIFAGRILSRIGLPALKKETNELLESEMDQASFAFYHFHKAKWEGADLSLLHEALWQRYCESVDLVIQLLAPSDHDASLLCRALRSGDEKAHSHAVETAEKLCPPKLIGELLALIDDRPVGEKIRLYLKQGKEVLSVSELLTRFQRSPRRTEQLTAEALLKTPEPQEELEVIRA